jgi:DNA polymerase III epsilon subunit-like protein
MKTLVWDIETGNFKADIGRTICMVGFDVTFDPTKIPSVQKFTAEQLRTHYPYRGLYILRRDEKPGRGVGKHGKTDEKLVKECRKLLDSYDHWVSYNGKMFDVPFLNTRLYEFGQPVLPKALHSDIYYKCRKPAMTLTSARLENVMRFFGCKHQKIALDPLLWREAIEGDKEATDEVVRHCVADVLGCAEVYNHVKPQIRNIHRG